MIKHLTYGLLILLALTSCKKEYPDTIKNETNVTPTYSLPLGNYTFKIVDSLEVLKNLSNATFDSLFYNEELIPNPNFSIHKQTIEPIDLSAVALQYKNIKLLELKLFVINTYPTDFNFSFSLYNNNDLIWTPDNFPESVDRAPVNNDGYTVDSTTQSITIAFPDNIIDQLVSINTFVFDFTINTRADDINRVRFFSQQYIKLYVGTKIELKTELNQ